MPIIVGAPRSGTTLLRFMLDANPALAIPPETGFLALGRALTAASDSRRHFFNTVTTYPTDAPAWPDFGIDKAAFWETLASLSPFTAAEGCRAFYRLYAARLGKSRWGDKTPTYGQHLPAITELLPEAYIIHLIRDGRDVARSLRGMWFSPGDEIETLARYWKDSVVAIQQHGARCEHYTEVRFEELVLSPEPVLRRLCAWLRLEFSSHMLEYHRNAQARLVEHRDRIRPDGTTVVSREKRLQQQALTTAPPQPSRVRAWRADMSADERQRFESIASDLLDALGYQ